MKEQDLYDALGQVGDDLIEKSAPDAMPGKKTVKILRFRPALIAAVAILLVAAITIPLIAVMMNRTPDPTQSTTSQTTPAGTQTTPDDTQEPTGDTTDLPVIPAVLGDVSSEIPDWYTPGELELTALLFEKEQEVKARKARMASKFTPLAGASILNTSVSTGLMKIEGDAEGFMDGYNGRYINMYTNLPEGHEACRGHVYRDTETGSTICIAHLLAGQLGVPVEKFYFDDLHAPSYWTLVRLIDPIREKCIAFVGAGPAAVAVYVCDLKNQTLKALPKAVADTFYNFIETFAISDDFTKVLYFDNGGKDLMLMTTNDDGGYGALKLPCPCDGKESIGMGVCCFSPDGRYVMYSITVDGYLFSDKYDPYLRVYDTQTGNYVDLTGRLLRWAENGTDVVIFDYSSVRAFSLATGEETTATADLKPYELYYVDWGEDFEDQDAGKISVQIYGPDRKPVREDALYDNVDAFAVYGEFLYIFSAEKETVYCRSITPGSELFGAKPDEAFLDAMKALPENEYTLCELNVSPDGTRLYLFFDTRAMSDYEKREAEKRAWKKEVYGDSASLSDFSEKEWRKIAAGDTSRFDFETYTLFLDSMEFSPEKAPQALSFVVSYIFEHGEQVDGPLVNEKLRSRMSIYLNASKYPGCFSYQVHLNEVIATGEVRVTFNLWDTTFILTQEEFVNLRIAINRMHDAS